MAGRRRRTYVVDNVVEVHFRHQIEVEGTGGAPDEDTAFLASDAVAKAALEKAGLPPPQGPGRGVIDWRMQDLEEGEPVHDAASVLGLEAKEAQA